MPERSVHDNRIVAYQVDAERRRIVLHTRDEEPVPAEQTDIVFEGVLAYYFEGDNLGSILAGVKEIALEQLVGKNRALFEREHKYAWPGPWNTSPEASLHHFQSNGAKAFEISSYYGLAGWVVADACRFEVPPGERAV